MWRIASVRFLGSTVDGTLHNQEFRRNLAEAVVATSRTSGFVGIVVWLVPHHLHREPVAFWAKNRQENHRNLRKQLTAQRQTRPPRRIGSRVAVFSATHKQSVGKMPTPRGETQYFSRAGWGNELTCGWVRSGRQERSPCSRRPRASLKVDHSRAREPVYDFYKVYECGRDKLGRREGLRREKGGFSAAYHPSVTGFIFLRCSFQDVRLNTFGLDRRMGPPLGLGGPWAAKRGSAFLGEATTRQAEVR